MVTKADTFGSKGQIRLKRTHTQDMFRGAILDNDFSGTATSNPTKLWYYHTYFATQNSVNTNISCVFELDFIVEFYNRISVN